jgi:hypothetical protein
MKKAKRAMERESWEDVRKKVRLYLLCKLTYQIVLTVKCVANIYMQTFISTHCIIFSSTVSFFIRLWVESVWKFFRVFAGSSFDGEC